ncbi:hypothetical protein AB0C81_26585 [Streptomyces roseoverticillatus]|uniref:hypothetical protein n=1 Tax=Streptomyces roseoverticillatus TaxID=66429 RepID=UPI0033E71114
MSATAAPAGALMHRNREFADNSVDGCLGGIPRQRGVLRSAPASGQPDGDGPGEALRLGRGIRLRLLAAVRALLADPSLEGLGDAARLSAVVLYAKSRAPRGGEGDLQSSIWGAELGRWLGMSESTVHHKVLPALRASDALHTKVVTDAAGQPTGLDCLVMPLWRAHHGGGAAHPLALSKAELATLLRLLEALFGPGWTPKGKAPVPAGLLAGRMGKGAATDRLGLLLMVLNTRASGWLQLCGGSVKAREGRGAATLARLLGCSPAGARKVLARLTEAGVVARQRKATVTQMNGRGRVMLLPVAQAFGRVVAPVEVAQGSEAVLSQRPDGAVGDHAPAEGAGALGTPGFCGAQDTGSQAGQERPDGAEFHADHASVVTPVVPPQLSCGFSGEGRGGDGRRPERVCVREDQAADGATPSAGSGSPMAEGGPLRGEQPEESPIDARVEQQSAARVEAGDQPKAVSGGNGQQLRRVGLPADLRLRVALAPVAGLWERLSGWQQDQVEAAAKVELARLSGVLVRPEAAPPVLADRLADRLRETGGEALVTSPYAWLTRRGLVQRPACWDRRCDDGFRLDTGSECGSCDHLVGIRRAQRARIAAEVDAQMPGLPPGERRQILEDRLREQAAREAEGFMWRREQSRAEQARWDVARVIAEERAEHERQVAAAAEEARQALSCEDCGQEEAAGLCEACGYRRQTEALIVEASLVAATWSADLDDTVGVATVAANVRATVEGQIAAAREEFLRVMEPSDLDTDPGTAAALAFGALHTAQQAASEYRQRALEMLSRTEQAEAEARRGYATEQNRGWFRANPNGADAVAAATMVAEAARSRTAEHLLRVRLEQLSGRAAEAVEQAASTPWTRQLPELAA